ncbi:MULTISPECIES: Mu-like prophage major head subunit gpT family protein [unclassified Marinimicrobium]|jgi:phage major head subunit gpT-like protein|uniref:Mu-like prophage major head subunit gpT family protein n=1 Tax=unclassified Marinimicrobium TaxID=2632100 RepID=UPI000C61EF5B|nr:MULTISPECIES: Mu-like prophage major head subunit gpT family protein [unclassified Marinimicrobium]MAN51211.1 hypothetical protein [Marinimicrobium sp.]
MIVNRQNLSMAYTGFKATFQNAFDGAPVNYTQITTEVPSATSSEEYAWLGQTTRFREWIGDRVIQAIKQHGYTIKNKTWENTVGVPREAFEDDQYGIYTPLMAQLGQDSREHPDELVFALMKQGETEECYDGQPFFDTDHPVLAADGSETSVSNLTDGAETEWYLLDTSRAIRPFIYQNRKPYNFVMKDSEQDDNVFLKKEFLYGVDGRSNVGFGLWQLAHKAKVALTADNFNSVYAAMKSMKGDNGRPLNIRPNLLVVPPSLRAQALEVVKAERAANGATNINRDVVDVLDTSWLA